MADGRIIIPIDTRADGRSQASRQDRRRRAIAQLFAFQPTAPAPAFQETPDLTRARAAGLIATPQPTMVPTPLPTAEGRESLESQRARALAGQTAQMVSAPPGLTEFLLGKAEPVLHRVGEEVAAALLQSPMERWRAARQGQAPVELYRETKMPWGVKGFAETLPYFFMPAGGTVRAGLAAKAATAGRFAEPMRFGAAALGPIAGAEQVAGTLAGAALRPLARGAVGASRAGVRAARPVVAEAAYRAGQPRAALRVLGKPQVAGAAAKEPWQMTREEFITSRAGRGATAELEAAHSAAVTRAMQEGKPVPRAIAEEMEQLARKMDIRPTPKASELTWQEWADYHHIPRVSPNDERLARLAHQRIVAEQARRAQVAVGQAELPVRGVRPPGPLQGLEGRAPRAVEGEAGIVTPGAAARPAGIEMQGYRLMPDGAVLNPMGDSIGGVSRSITEGAWLGTYGNRVVARGQSPQEAASAIIQLDRRVAGARPPPVTTPIVEAPSAGVQPPIAKPEAAPPAPAGAPPPAEALPIATRGVGPPARPPVPLGGPVGPEDADRLLRQFATYIHSPESINFSELTLQLRREQLGQRVAILQSRLEDLLGQGQKFEDALRQAQAEAMTGAFERPGAILQETMAEQFRDAAFAHVHEVLATEPLEQMATAEALRNALAGQAIPRVPGTAGGSAYTRLSRIFPPEVMDVLAKGKPISEVMEDALLSPTARYQFTRGLGEWDASLWREAGEQLGLDIAQVPPFKPIAQKPLTPAERFPLEAFGAREPTGVTRPLYEAPIEAAIKRPHLMPVEAQHLIVRSLKEAGWSAVDIGNFLRANKASFDFSFWRQQAPLILNHKRDFVHANIEAWRALWKKGAAETSWRRIQNDPLFQVYEELGLDFLRPLELRPGMSRYRGVEEFGFLQSDRPIPKFTGKLPWVKVSQRAFVTGTNEHNWRIFKGFYQDMLKVNERIAAGEIRLKPGEGFSIQNNLRDFGKLLEDFSGRGSLGKGRELAPALSALAFAPRYAWGRLISPRHLFSANPYVRKEAWKNAASFVGGFGSLLVLGDQLGLWHVELDPRSSDFAKIRIGNTRIDPWGGYQQFVRFFAQIATNSGVSAETGQPYKLDPLQSLTRFLRGKASPLAGMVADFKTGKTYVGDDVNLLSPKQWIDRVIPLLPMDIYEAITEGDIPRGGIVALPAAVGAGVSTYGKIPRAWQEDMAPYFDIPTTAAERQAKGVTITRETYRRRNPEVDAKLFITGQVESLQSLAAKLAAAKLMREHNIPLTEIKGLEVQEYEGPFDDRVKLRRWFQDELAEGPAIPTGQPQPGFLGAPTGIAPSFRDLSALNEWLRQRRAPAGVR